jgi:ATP-binding cassette subfamily B protein
MARPKTPRKTIKLYWQTVRRYRGWLLMHLLTVAAAVLLQNIAVPYLLTSGLRQLPKFLAHPGANFQDYFGSIIILYILCQVGAWVFWRTSGWAIVTMEVGVMRDLEQRIFRHLTTLSYRFFANSFSGALVTQANRFVSSYERLYDSLSFDIMPLILKTGFSFVIIGAFAPGVAVGLLIFCTFFILSAITLFTWKMPSSSAAASAHTTLIARLADNLTNVSAIKYFARERDEIRSFDGITQNHFKLARKDWYQQEFINAWQAILMMGFETAVFIFSLHLVATRQIDFAQLVLVQAFIWNIFGSLWNVGRIARNIERSLSDANEMTEILYTQPEVVDVPRAKPVHITRGSVAIRGLTFSYHESGKDQPVFENLDLEIKPGEKIGLVGTSGGGKTTVTKLLLRLMDIQGGTIELDGHNIAKMRQQDVRRAVSYVPQEPLLFHRALRENIAYGHPEATETEILAAARRAHAHEFIQKLPEGYDTLVGERGIKLSGGQRQRVAIARAMLKDAPILVLDEATSALDSESEKLIQDALWRLMEGRTAIVIAHRLSTIQRMDRIVVLEDGNIVEQGSHHQLLDHGGTYAKLWSHQSGGFLEEGDVPAAASRARAD